MPLTSALMPSLQLTAKFPAFWTYTHTMQAESSTSASSSSAAAAEACLPSFARGVIALLQIWPALRLAVTHNWKPAHPPTSDPEFPPENASQKRTRLAEELVDAYFSTYTSPNTQGKTPDSEEIEDFLLEFFEYEYGVKLEDNSEVQVAKDADALWKECIAKSSGQSTSEALLEKFEKLADKARSEDSDPAKALRGTRTGEQDEEDDDEYSTDEDDDGDDGEEMEVDGQQRTSSSHSHNRREEPEIDEDGFQTVTKGSKGRH